MRTDKTFLEYSSAAAFAKTLAERGVPHRVSREGVKYVVVYVLEQPPSTPKERPKPNVEELLRRAKDGTAPLESLELALENANTLGLTPEQISVLEDARREKIRVLREQPVGCPTCLQVPCICAGRDSYWSTTDR